MVIRFPAPAGGFPKLDSGRRPGSSAPTGRCEPRTKTPASSASERAALNRALGLENAAVATGKTNSGKARLLRLPRASRMIDWPNTPPHHAPTSISVRLPEVSRLPFLPDHVLRGPGGDCRRTGEQEFLRRRG